MNLQNKAVKNRFPKFSQTLTTLLFTLLVTVPLLVFLLFITRETHINMNKESRAESLNRAQLVSSLFDELFNRTLIHIKGHELLLAKALMSKSNETIEEETEELYMASADIWAVAIFTPEGKGTTMVPNKKAHKRDANNEMWFKNYVKNGRKPMISNLSDTVSMPKMKVIRAVYPLHFQNKEIAVASVILSLPNLRKWIKNIDLPAGTAFAVIDREKTVVIFSKNQPAGLVGKKFLEFPDDKTGFLKNPLTGEDSVGAVVSIRKYGWRVISWQSEKSVTNVISAQNSRYFVIFFSLVLIGVYLSTLVGKYQQKNINLMEELENSLSHQQNIARILQENLAPRLPENLPLDVYAKYVSATDKASIGGDFFEVIPLTNEKIIFAVGDVSGKGIDAAVASAMVRYMLRTMVTIGLSPAKILRLLNNAVFPYFKSGSFVTMVCALYDIPSKNLIIARAGHYHPIIYGSLGPECDKPSFPLGVFESTEFGECSHTLMEGECVLFFTDGLIETRTGNDLFGLERLEEAFKEYDIFVNSAEELVNHVYKKSFDFCNGNVKDDIAVVAFKA